ncbi:hypothetical protein [Ancylomarina sp.]|uniref:hypothetical protein n=1 Tax=Ancylomarina sp. TaxID=1970196 RepID=UPI003562C892
MKKLLLSLVVCLGLVSFASQTFAQSTAVEPYDGAKHTYTFSDVEANATYKFYVSTSVAAYGVGSEVADFGAFTGTGTGLIGGTNGDAAVEITWATDAAAKYGAAGVYLFLEVTAASSTCGVGNYKAVHIMPKSNNFNVDVVATITNPSCASLVALQPVVNDADINVNTDYVAGTTTMTFDITRQNATNKWSGGYDVTCSDATVSFTISGAPAATGTKSGTIAAETNNTVTVTLVMTNTPGSNPTFTLTMTNATDDATALSDLSLDSDSQVINLMPSIGGFVGI